MSTDPHGYDLEPATDFGSGSGPSRAGARSQSRARARDAKAPPRRRRKARRVHRVVRHIDIWSLAKIGAVYVACGYIISMISGFILWRAADIAGTIDGIEGFMEDTGGYDTFEMRGDVVFSSALLIGAVLSMLAVCLIILAGILFNLISDLTGGIRMTVIDEDLLVTPARRGSRPRRPAPDAVPADPDDHRPTDREPDGADEHGFDDSYDTDDADQDVTDTAAATSVVAAVTPEPDPEPPAPAAFTPDPVEAREPEPAVSEPVAPTRPTPAAPSEPAPPAAPTEPEPPAADADVAPGLWESSTVHEPDAPRAEPTPEPEPTGDVDPAFDRLVTAEGPTSAFPGWSDVDGTTDRDRDVADEPDGAGDSAGADRPATPRFEIDFG